MHTSTILSSLLFIITFLPFFHLFFILFVMNVVGLFQKIYLSFFDLVKDVI
jgi:hypothetical protein